MSEGSQKKSTQSNTTVIVITAALVLIIISSIFAYTLRQNSIEETNRQKAAQDAENSAKISETLDKEFKLLTCQNQALEDYNSNWWANCSLPSASQVDKKKKTCTLPLELAKTINSSYQKALDNCVALYK